MMDINDSVYSDGNIISSDLTADKILKKYKNMSKIKNKKKIIKKLPTKAKTKYLINCIIISLIIIFIFIIFVLFFPLLYTVHKNLKKKNNLNIQKTYKIYNKTPIIGFKNNTNNQSNTNITVNKKEYLPKVLICSIAKLENNYVRHFIEEHKKIGVNKIVIYDNNDVNGENLTSVVLDYIESGYVTVKNVRGLKEQQYPVYTKCYHEYENEFNWIGFFDLDEVVTIYNNSEFKTINEFLSLKKFEKADSVVLSFKFYDDNNLTKVINNNYSLVSRFTHFNNIYGENRLIKVFFRSKKIRGRIRDEHHPPFLGSGYIYMNVLGEKKHYGQTIDPPVHWPVCVKHFKYKTIEEYMKTKANRGSANHNNPHYSLRLFFYGNKFTENKMNFLLDYTKNMTDFRKELFEIMKEHNISFNYNESLVNNENKINNN